MKIFFIILAAFSICCCQNKSPLKVVDKERPDDSTVVVLEEHYTDSLNIGVSGKYKLDFKKFRTEDSIYADINLYEKDGQNWNHKQKLHFLKDGVLSCDIEFKDYTNDGLKDLTFQSSIAARGANVIRKLLLFDKEKGTLKYITNSEDFPNLRYNKDLNCIDGFRVTGGTQSVFAKIEGDSLREFADVDLFDDTITITVIGKNGKPQILKHEKFENGNYMRFKNYNPLQEYDSKEY